MSAVEKELVLLKRRWGAALVQESATKFSVAFAPTDPELPAEVGRTLTLRSAGCSENLSHTMC